MKWYLSEGTSDHEHYIINQEGHGNDTSVCVYGGDPCEPTPEETQLAQDLLAFLNEREA